MSAPAATTKHPLTVVPPARRCRMRSAPSALATWWWSAAPCGSRRSTSRWVLLTRDSFVGADAFHVGGPPSPALALPVHGFPVARCPALLSSMRSRQDMLPSLPPPMQALKFGAVFTDHMFVAEHAAGRGWAAPAIRPLAPIALHPAAQVLHYGMCAFEGEPSSWWKAPGKRAALGKREHCIRRACCRWLHPPFGCAQMML